MKAQTKHKRQRRRDTLVLKLALLVILVLIIFEGPLVYTMLTHNASTKSVSTAQKGKDQEAANGLAEAESEARTEKPSLPRKGSQLAGFAPGAALPSTAQTDAAKEPVTERKPTVYNPDSPAIVAKRDTPVDDSYFADAAFIGDSRMEGFRNASGITQGRFFTSVGMSTSKMASDPIISTPEGNITVAAALSGGTYNKIYIMLGANDLGEYDWEAFRQRFTSAVSRFKELQPNALIYVCSCIYVDETKNLTSYVNNENAVTLNKILLEICETEGYHYLDLNEFLSDGNGSLISDASSDGVHLYPQYCQQMLEYLKNHYVDAPAAADSAEGESESESESESETEQDSKSKS